MMHLLPPNLVNELAEKANARSVETARRIAAEREEREKRLDESGFHLLAGENTDIIHSGTWRECRNNLFKLLTHKIPRDSYSGKGCWVIVKDGEEFESGYFSADTYWQTR